MADTEEKGAKCFGGAGVLHIIATSRQPMTSREVAELAPISHITVRSTLKRLYRTGYVYRHRAESGGKGPAPFEYKLAPRWDYGE